MREMTPAVETRAVVIEIGSLPIRLRTVDARFSRMLKERYAGFTPNG